MGGSTTAEGRGQVIRFMAGENLSIQDLEAKWGILSRMWRIGTWMVS